MDSSSLLPGGYLNVFKSLLLRIMQFFLACAFVPFAILKESLKLVIICISVAEIILSILLESFINFLNLF